MKAMSVRAVLRAPFQRQAWAELGYVLVGIGFAALGPAYVVGGLILTIGLSVTAVGVPLLALVLVGTRRLGGLHRDLARRLLREQVAAPPERAPVKGFYPRVQAGLSDVLGWRAMAFLVLQLPGAVLQFYVVLVTWGWGAVAASYPLQHVFGVNDVPVFDAAGRQVLVSVAGFGLLLLAPWAVHASTLPNRMLVRWLLGSTGPAERIRDLEQTRARAVDDAVATLRTIERDLHDGAQARLVALSMQLALVADAIPAGPAHDLAAAAQLTAREAIVELRELVRGLHPPVLDQGLPAALSSLVVHSSVPVELRFHTDIDTDTNIDTDIDTGATDDTSAIDRPTPAIESMAYFCAAELITNAAKHSQASRIWLDVVQGAEGLRLQVRDDGIGGAAVSARSEHGIGGRGTGLAGLVERVGTVDGRLQIESPDGGPTVVTVTLPSHA